MSDDEFWKSTAAKIWALSDMKYPRERVESTPEDGSMKADTGAICDVDAMRAGFKALGGG